MGFLFQKTKIRGPRRQPAHPVRVGQVNKHVSKITGGGGPANAGARSSKTASKLQPDFRNSKGAINNPYIGEFEKDEYFGAAAPSRTPDLAGIPMNNFRKLGDQHGGRG